MSNMGQVERGKINRLKKYIAIQPFFSATHTHKTELTRNDDSCGY